ncbi:MAG: HlyC/CorC family transporter [Gammaproteobacteria bacterium]|nr:MAG: HlyC/CorC family transporter [Gammaproteobacteria bacterium]
MDDVPLGALLGALVLLLLCSAFFSGTETALMSLNRYRLRHMARSGHRGARYAETLLQRPERLIGLILFGNNLVQNSAAAIVTLIAFKLGGAAGIIVGTMVITILILIFGELTPKTLGAVHPERLAFPGAYAYHAMLRFLPPISWLVGLIGLVSNGILRLIGVRPDASAAHNLTIEELRTIVAESGALLPRKRHEIMMRVLNLGEITVEDIMIPQNEVVGIDLDDDLANIVRTIQESGYTRLPVYREAIDNVVGLLHVKRLIQYSGQGNLSKPVIESLADEPYFVPESTPLNRQLVQFQRTRRRTGFVVDEYGDIQGIVTLEDLLEEIVGEFTSEPVEGRTEVRRDEAGGGYIVDAGSNVRVLNRTMNWKLPTDGPKTLNGLILEKLGAIPRKGTGVMLNDFAVEILQTSDNAVETVRIREPAESLPRAAAGA